MRACEDIATANDVPLPALCSALRLFGLTKRDLLGKNINNLIPPPMAQQHQHYMSAFLKTGVTVSMS